MVYNLFDWITSNHPFLTFLAVALSAGATAILAFLTGWTLYVLRRYAADTKRLAEIGFEQLERSQTPFVVLVMQGGSTPETIGYRIENHGSGPALNILSVLDWEGGGRQHFLPQTLGAGGFYGFEAYHRCLKADFTYESLSGRKYATKINFKGAIEFIRLLREQELKTKL